MAFLIVTSLFCLFSAIASDPLMRKDGTVPQSSRKASVALHVGASGSLLGLAPKEQVKEGIDTCIDDYPLGQIGTNECTDSADAPKHHPISTREMCLQAASEAGVTVENDIFTLKSDMQLQIQHPMGCFKHSCKLVINNTVEHAKAQVTPNPVSAKQNTTVASGGGGAGGGAGGGNATLLALESLTGDCYFFNPIGYKPGPEADQPPLSKESTLVCYRPKITKGANDTNGGCKTGYDVIYDEDTCREAATCLGMKAQCTGEFRKEVLNNSQYDEFPHGCFINVKKADGTGSGDDCVYFNKKPLNWPRMPARPIGVNLCNVSSVTNVASVGTVAGSGPAVSTAATNAGANSTSGPSPPPPAPPAASGNSSAGS